MTTVQDILLELQESGHTVRLDGDTVRIRPPLPPERREFLRQHKAELVSLLRANSTAGTTVLVSKPAKPQQNENNDTTVPPKTFTRLELATAALTHLVPDEQQRRKIRALAEADAKGWRFLGSEAFQHVLSGSIMDQVEAQTKKLICFQCNADNQFTGWHVKEIKP